MIVSMKTCRVRSCDGPPHTRLGYCRAHYNRLKRTGKLRPSVPVRDNMVGEPWSVRFWAKVDKGSGCWLWQGTRDSSGYGMVTILKPRRTTTKAHRMAWTLTNGPIPDGLLVCHHCDTPQCVRPDHLFLGTAKDNAHDKMAKGRLRVGHVKGEQCGRAKLTEAAVRDIRASVAAGTRQVRMAEKYNVSPMTICDIVHGRRWKHVT